jgi:hypothetical protein
MLLLISERMLNCPVSQPLHTRNAALCEDIEYIIGDYGNLKGSLQGANIIIPGLSGTAAGAVVRQFLAFLDPANLNVYELYESIASCTTAGAADEKVTFSPVFFSAAKGESSLTRCY